MKTGMVKVINAVGLHARPAALFVKEANRFRSRIQVRNLTTHSSWGAANSLLGLLRLGVEKDHEIEIQAEGEDESQALESLIGLVEMDFVGH